ncbi:MAG: DUF1656 domain-containing protein [Halomonas sp.]|uniref:DUF1656 domain-containing protein n=1 Tax=Halomonas sp. TaxID=1486246 RepID=UPI0018405636|nr:DUF1656 domain-containing protein [Halomonas sp.]NWN82939.1 DUF1656 domain-containing protein [Halomonas sp.]
MPLREVAIGGLYLSPLLLYALAGFGATLLIRSLLFKVLGANRLWFEAWFDVSLFVICTAAAAYLSCVATGALS